MPAPPTLLLYVASTLPRAWKRKVQLRLWITSALFRHALGHLTPRQIQALAPSTLETYNEWIRKMQAGKTQGNLGSKLLESNVVPLPVVPPASILWIGDVAKATKFVLFFHGGGYMAPLNPGHLNWIWNAYIQQGERKHPGQGAHSHQVAVAVLQYSLSPEAKYPTQLRQAVAALNHMIGEGIDPKGIIFGGDSAGGNLSVQLLRHLSHPVPGVEPVKLDDRRVTGVFLVSPWVSGWTDTVSFRDNGSIDMLSATIVKESATHVLSHGDNQSGLVGAHPALALGGGLDWLQSIQRATESLYITCGDQEVFHDHVLALSEAIRRRNQDLILRVDVGAGEVHDALLLEGSHNVIGDATRKMRGWAASRLKLGELD